LVSKNAGKNKPKENLRKTINEVRKPPRQAAQNFNAKSIRRFFSQ